MSTEIKALKPMQRVKIISGPKEAPHPLNYHIGTIRGVHTTRKNQAGTVIYKSYEVSFGHASTVREVEARFLYPVGE